MLIALWLCWDCMYFYTMANSEYEDRRRNDWTAVWRAMPYNFLTVVNNEVSCGELQFELWRSSARCACARMDMRTNRRVTERGMPSAHLCKFIGVSEIQWFFRPVRDQNAIEGSSTDSMDGCIWCQSIPELFNFIFYSMGFHFCCWMEIVGGTLTRLWECHMCCK